MTGDTINLIAGELQIPLIPFCTQAQAWACLFPLRALGPAAAP